MVFVVISLLITIFLMKPKYEANTQVLVNQKESNEQYRAQEVQSNIQLVNTYSEILKSPRILEDVAKKIKISLQVKLATCLQSQNKLTHKF